jgi:hypothetical protein
LLDAHHAHRKPSNRGSRRSRPNGCIDPDDPLFEFLDSADRLEWYDRPCPKSCKQATADAVSASDPERPNRYQRNSLGK